MGSHPKGWQCYNCLNGAHHICSGRPRCRKPKARKPGLLLVFK